MNHLKVLIEQKMVHRVFWTFAALRKATISRRECLSAWGSSAPTGRIFMTFEDVKQNSSFIKVLKE